MDSHGHADDTEHADLFSLLTAQYSEACQSFVLRDFDATTGIINDLLERIERDNLGVNNSTSTTSTPSELDELVRRVWILYITLIASADDELASDPKQAESELAGAHSRIEHFYAQGHTTSSSTATTTPSLPSSSTIIHPSLLVAISLAGLKLEIPSFVQRTLQEYFRIVISNAAAATSSPLSNSQGDISTLDVSHADLSLSGMAVNGHAPNGHAVNGHAVNGTYGHTVNGTSNTAASNNKKKSLHRLSRIYSINMLGRSLGEWSNARSWIRELADDDNAVAAGLISDSYAQTLLDALEEAKAQQEEEEREARQAEKTEKERQAELKKTKRSGTSTSTSRQVHGEASSSGTNGHSLSSSPPTRPERSKERASAQEPPPSASSLPTQEQETGFAAFRSHLSSFLSTSSDSPSSSSLSQRPHSHMSHNPNSTSLDMLRIYLSRFVHSKLLKVLLAFFIITGFWRRRLARRGGGGVRLDIGKRLTTLKDKVVETVKMGGSLGFL